jgi:hypothetical protein
MSWLRKHFSVNAWSDWSDNPAGTMDVNVLRLHFDHIAGAFYSGAVGLIGLNLTVTYYPRGKA